VLKLLLHGFQLRLAVLRTFDRGLNGVAVLLKCDKLLLKHGLLAGQLPDLRG
jgi:hypothetical protein